MKKVKILNSMSKIIAVILFIIIATLVISIYFSFSDLVYIESVFEQIENKLTYREDIYLLQGNNFKNVLLELNLKELEMEYKKYKIQSQMKIITNTLVLIIAFISVGTIQNLIYNIEIKEDYLKCTEENIEYPINQINARDHFNALRNEVPK